MGVSGPEPLSSPEERGWQKGRSWGNRPLPAWAGLLEGDEMPRGA